MNNGTASFSRNLERDEMLVIDGGGTRIGFSVLEILGNGKNKSARVLFDDPLFDVQVLTPRGLRVSEELYISTLHLPDTGRKIAIGIDCPRGYTVEHYDSKGELKRKWSVR